MATVEERCKDPEYINSVKSSTALDFTNQVLRAFVVKEITRLHQSIVKKLPKEPSCRGCKVNTGCSKGICNEIQLEIEKNHWFSKPSFKNTSTRLWRTEPWEIAKCYMPQSNGCKDSSTKDADFTDCINVIINCKHFEAFGTSDPRITETVYTKSKAFRNRVLHASPLKVTEHDMRENLDILISILNKIKTPETEGNTKDAIKEIEKIKANRMTITLKHVIEYRSASTNAVADKLEKDEDQVQRERLLVTFVASCREALCRLTEENISIQEGHLSVTAFLSKIGMFADRKDLSSRHQNMLFPKTGTHTDIRKWDLFVYCFILEELDLYEPIGKGVSLFVREVKKIRNRLVLDASGVTQNDLSKLCKHLIDNDLNTEITEIFNKDCPDVDVIRSFNILGSWWREEEDYGRKPVSKKQLNETKQVVKRFKEKYRCWAETIRKIHWADENLEHVVENVTLQGANAAELDIDADCELRVRGCDEKTEEALQEHITSPDNNDIERNEAFDHFRQQRNLREVNPEEGSIILNVKCSSITIVIDFWDSCIDGRTEEALLKVRNYYRRYYKCDTLEFDVILTKKGVSRCVDKIVEDLFSRLDVLVDNLVEKIKEPKKNKSLEGMEAERHNGAHMSESPASNLPKTIDIRTEEERTKEEKQVKDIKPIPQIGKDSMVVGDGSDTLVKSGDSVRDIDKHTREEVDRLVKILRQISEDLEGGSIASIKQHVGDIIRYSKDDNEKMIDEFNKKFLKQILESGTSPNLIRQAMRGFHMIRHDPSLGDLVQSEIDLIEKEQLYTKPEKKPAD